MSEILYTLSTGTDIVRDGADTPQMGIEQKVALIPTSNLDVFDATQFVKDGTYAKGRITDLVPSAAAFIWYGQKGMTTMNAGVRPRETPGRVGSEHFVSGLQLPTNDIAKTDLFNKWYYGGETVFALIEKRQKGIDGEEAFWFVGGQHGLKITNYNGDLNESNGQDTFDLVTPDGLSEDWGLINFYKTSYPVSKTDVWVNKFA